MKKLTAILFCAIVLTVLSACGGGQSSAPTEITEITAAQTEAETKAEAAAATEPVSAPTSATSAPESARVDTPTEAAADIPTEDDSEPLLAIETGGRVFYADFEDNSSAEALKENLRGGSITLSIRDYGGFEKVGDLPFSLVTNDEEITTSAGDVILYQGNQLTIYYDVNTWSFTRVARIRGADSSLKEQLGEGDISVTLSLI